MLPCDFVCGCVGVVLLLCLYALLHMARALSRFRVEIAARQTNNNVRYDGATQHDKSQRASEITI